MPTWEFNENNSGGHWWLDKKQYDALFAAGWSYTPDEYDKEQGHDTKPWPHGDQNVPYGWRHGLTFEAATIREAVESWEATTGADFFAQGCNCCGAPFSISGGIEYLSGDSIKRKAIRPW